MATLETYNPVGNGAEPAIDLNRPYTVEARLIGTAALLLHRWSNEAVREKAAAGKNTAAKKTDNIESYVYRDEAGHICLPGLYLQRALQEAGRFRQDPRSPRKSALDLCKAGIMVTPELSPILVNDQPTADWDYLDQRRVVVQRSGIERSRPAFRLGWSVVVQITSILPEYIGEQFLRGLIDDAGRLIGVGDFRPTYGRFTVVSWSRLPE